MTARRPFVVALGVGALAPPTLFAQSQRIYRVGVLSHETVASSKIRMDAFVATLRERGYTDGGNLVLLYRYADGDTKRLPALAEELMRERPDVIFAPSGITALAAKKASGATPIVFSNVGDPVAMGLVASLARPGGSVTGTTNITADLAAKRLEILKAAVPSLSRVAVLRDDFAGTGQLEVLRTAAKALGAELLITDLMRSEDFERRLAEFKDWRADALFVTSGPRNTFHRELHARLAQALRIASMGGSNDFAEAGGLVSYGPNFPALYRRAAVYVDRILKGARPADLPVEQPTVFELVVNVRVASALGIKIPATVLLRADRVIE